MFYFPNLDDETRNMMIQELEFDIKADLFYEPLSMTVFGHLLYKSLLKESFKEGTPETLLRQLTPSFFKDKDKKGRKIPLTIRETIAFSDFNRYYMRALLLRALLEDRKLCVYRAKKSKSERKESNLAVNRVYFDKSEIGSLLELLRDYRRLFGLHSETDLLKPNSGLSLRFIGNISL